MNILPDMIHKYATGHAPILCRAIFETRNTKGPVIEFGVGYGSTLILKELCHDRELYSLEHNELWYNTFKVLESDNHHIIKVNDFNSIGIEKNWDVAFVDHGIAETRGLLLEKLLNKARIIVLHDTEVADYNYESYTHLYKFRLDFKPYCPWTTILSNEIDVSKWGLPLSTAFRQ